MDEVEIYKKLKQIRKERGLTLNTLAEKMGADYQQISRIERGKSRLTIDVLMKMAEALDTPIDEIMRTLPQDKKSTSAKAAQKVKDTSQDWLAVILEKIEIAGQETQTNLRPQIKALLISQIYTQVLQMQQASRDSTTISSFIDFSVSMVKTLLAELTLS